MCVDLCIKEDNVESEISTFFLPSVLHPETSLFTELTYPGLLHSVKLNLYIRGFVKSKQQAIHVKAVETYIIVKC
jgi:hypothetical protein